MDGPPINSQLWPLRRVSSFVKRKPHFILCLLRRTRAPAVWRTFATCCVWRSIRRKKKSSRICSSCKQKLVSCCQLLSYQKYFFTKISRVTFHGDLGTKVKLTCRFYGLPLTCVAIRSKWPKEKGWFCHLFTMFLTVSVLDRRPATGAYKGTSHRTHSWKSWTIASRTTSSGSRAVSSILFVKRPKVTSRSKWIPQPWKRRTDSSRSLKVCFCTNFNLLHIIR